MTNTMPAKPIVETDDYWIEHAQGCAIAGYLIIFVKPKASNLAELPSRAQQTIGEAISNGIKIVQAIIQPARIYTLSFGEQNPQLHFHIFPRTAQMLLEFNHAFNRQLNYADGAEMFNWARQYYRVSNCQYDEQCVQINNAFWQLEKNGA